MKLLTDYGNKVTVGDLTATIYGTCFVCPFWDMGGGSKGSAEVLIKVKKFFAGFSDKRIDRDHFMEMSSKWDDVEDYCYHFDFDVTNSNQRIFLPVRTMMSFIDEMNNIEKYLK